MEKESAEMGETVKTEKDVTDGWRRMVRKEGRKVLVGRELLMICFGYNAMIILHFSHLIFI